MALDATTSIRQIGSNAEAPGITELMLARSYLTGLEADDFDIPGVFGVRHTRVPGSWRILCTYADGRRHKARLFANMAAAGQTEARGTWDLHHVVEAQHYAEIDFAGRLEKLYDDGLPCVLVAKEEHRAYNSLLHISETDELFRDRGLSAELKRRSADAAAAARDRRQHSLLRHRVARLQQLYRTHTRAISCS